MKPLIDGFKAAFPDTKGKVHEIIGARGRVAVRASISGTHPGDWFGVAATGKSYEMPLHEFHHIADGKLPHTWNPEDCLGWLSQVGACAAGKQGSAAGSAEVRGRVCQYGDHSAVDV